MKKDDLSPEARDHLLKLYLRDYKQPFFSISEIGNWSDESVLYSEKLELYYHTAIFSLYQNGVFNDNQKIRIETLAKQIWRYFERILGKYPDAYLECSYRFAELVKIAGAERNLIKILKERIGKRYHEINDTRGKVFSENDIRLVTKKMSILMRQMAILG
jgi:hypothetical protein